MPRVLKVPGATITGTIPGMPDTTAPAAPTGLAATPTHNQVALSWTASTDNVGVTGYRVRRNGSLIASPGATSYTDADVALVNGTAYTYTVTAVDAAGNESAAATVSGTPTKWADTDLLSSGSLVLFEPGSPTAPLSAVPADAAVLTNLAATPATTLVGGAPNVSFLNSFANSGEGVIELTGKKGLHIMPSRTGSVTNHAGGLNLGSALRTYLAAHKTDDLYLSMWAKVTGTYDASLSEQAWMAKVSYDTYSTYHVALGVYPPSSALTSFPGTGSSDYLGRQLTTAGAGSFLAVGSSQVASGTTIDLPLLIVGPAGASQVNKVPAVIVYRVYLENLTASGRTYAQAVAIDQALFQQEMVASGGRYLGDTYTAP